MLRKYPDGDDDLASRGGPEHRLVAWYNQHRRQLPWRTTDNPYAIWVSEVMLQQTRVETVIPYYYRFLERFPSVEALARADEDEVLKVWQGLGYYSRLRNLQKAARAVVSEYGGVIPNTPEEFGKLPGVGPYTCGAVQSIAFSRPVPAVDGNVLRVMSRFLGIRQPIDNARTKATITAEVQDWLGRVPPSDLTQALMELGALVCTRTAKCAECPLREDCVARQAELTAEIPVKSAKKARKYLSVIAFWVEQDGAVVMQRRAQDGLLAGMWQFPSVEMDPLQGLTTGHLTNAQLEAAWTALHLHYMWGGEGGRSANMPDFVKIAEERHVFTHLEWLVEVYRPVQSRGGSAGFSAEERHRYEGVASEHNYVWQPVANLDELPVPRVYEKLIYRCRGNTQLRLLDSGV